MADTQKMGGARADGRRRTRRVPPSRRCTTCGQRFGGSLRFCPFDGDPLVSATPLHEAPTDPLIGLVVDERYEIVEPLGEGGMGVVYKARHLTLERDVALKILRADTLLEEDAVERFVREAKAAARIGHDGIVRVYDFGTVEASLPGVGRAQRPCFAMELLDGPTLADVLREHGAMPPGIASRLMSQLAHALSAAHAAGVVHRDIKPDNIVVRGLECGYEADGAERLKIKLVDFGVAALGGASKLTKAGQVFGTPYYMAPERASGGSGGGDTRVDIYALGVVLYECLAGHVPFRADTFMGVLTQHMFVDPEPLDVVVEDPSQLGKLGPVVMKCLEKDPDERFASMEELLGALTRTTELSGTRRRPRLQLRSSRPPAKLGRLAWRTSKAPAGAQRRLLRFGVGIAAVGLVVGGAVVIVAPPSTETNSTAQGAGAELPASNGGPPAISGAVAKPPEPTALASAAASLPPAAVVTESVTQPASKLDADVLTPPNPEAPKVMEPAAPNHEASSAVGITDEAGQPSEIVDPWK